jgi:hypothetical protein
MRPAIEAALATVVMYYEKRISAAEMCSVQVTHDFLTHKHAHTNAFTTLYSLSLSLSRCLSLSVSLSLPLSLYLSLSLSLPPSCNIYARSRKRKTGSGM